MLLPCCCIDCSAIRSYSKCFIYLTALSEMYELCNFQNDRKGTYFEHSRLLQTNTSPGLLQMAQYVWNITHSHY
jgi:hypothetical protein